MKKASVRIENYEQGTENSGGVTVGYAFSNLLDSPSWINHFVTSDQWTKNEMYFTTL